MCLCGELRAGFPRRKLIRALLLPRDHGPCPSLWLCSAIHVPIGFGDSTVSCKALTSDSLQSHTIDNGKSLGFHCARHPAGCPVYPAVHGASTRERLSRSAAAGSSAASSEDSLAVVSLSQPAEERRAKVLDENCDAIPGSSQNRGRQHHPRCSRIQSKSLLVQSFS